MTTFIITAGGTGKRMGTQIPKQLIKIKGEVVLMRTLRTFHTFNPQSLIVVVLPEWEIERWKEICRDERFTIPHTLVGGGKTRFHSVQNGLTHAPNEGVIGIHDGVRPLVSNNTIKETLEAAKLHGAAIPSVPLTDSLRQLTPDGSLPMNREHFRLVQTPQCFQATIIKKAYRQKWQESFTDDASVVEATGTKIFLTEGSRTNIKITHPTDIALAELWWD
jgi:2-C-methyl-D-erythritol 4-phosphate cytidylyltransferase